MTFKVIVLFFRNLKYSFYVHVRMYSQSSLGCQLCFRFSYMGSSIKSAVWIYKWPWRGSHRLKKLNWITKITWSSKNTYMRDTLFTFIIKRHMCIVFKNLAYGVSKYYLLYSALLNSVGVEWAISFIFLGFIIICKVIIQFILSALYTI